MRIRMLLIPKELWEHSKPSFTHLSYFILSNKKKNLKHYFDEQNSGYMAPEYAMEGLFSVKSDVFSFGVILLEIISGKRNSGFYVTELAPTLLAYVRFIKP